MDRKPNVVSIRTMTRSHAQAKVRALATHSANVILGKHAKDRMLERDITNTDVFRVLRSGSVDGVPTETERGEVKVKMVLRIRGSREVGVITLILHGNRLFVKTVEWEDPS